MQYRENNIYGSPFLRLIRSEVEALVSEKYGPDFLKQKQSKKELAEINKTLKSLKAQIQTLEARKSVVENKLPPEEAAEDPWGYIGFELFHFERFRDEMLGKKAYPRSVLLTCTCTYPECSCIMADMVFQEKTVVWTKIENPWLAGPTPSPWVQAEDALENGWVPLDYAALEPFIFDREQYFAALDDVSKRILPYYYG